MTVADETVQVAAALVLVFLLELGSVLAWTVADALGGHKEGRGQPGGAVAGQMAREPERAASGLAKQPVAHLQPSGSPVAAHELHGSPVVAQWAADEPQGGLTALEAVLRRSGGRFDGSQADLARLVGCNRSAMQRLMLAAKAAKLVRVETVRGHSTSVRLMAGAVH